MDVEPEFSDEQTDRDVTPTFRQLRQSMEYVQLDDGKWWEDEDDDRR